MRVRLTLSMALLLGALFAVTLPLPQGRAMSGPEIEAGVHSTLGTFFRHVRDSRDLANKALAVLVFPTVVKAGIGLGGEYGEGELLVRGQPAGFYNIASASVGLQLGAQARSVIIMFMTEGALNQFQSTDGFKVGVDGSIAIVSIGAGGVIDTNSITKPVIGFIFDQKGLMYNLTLEGTKISRISR
jgi:lipid-binding SYLF domain-containing protein